MSITAQNTTSLAYKFRIYIDNHGVTTPETAIIGLKKYKLLNSLVEGRDIRLSKLVYDISTKGCSPGTTLLNCGYMEVEIGWDLLEKSKVLQSLFAYVQVYNLNLMNSKIISKYCKWVWNGQDTLNNDHFTLIFDGYQFQFDIAHGKLLIEGDTLSRPN